MTPAAPEKTQYETKDSGERAEYASGMQPEPDEDHAAAVVFNLLAAETTAYRIALKTKSTEQVS
ncbi:hypothetical protein [Saccharopolyspora hattusasensis]|uniref:hypothetical protein n=1 Tax=Saccharopolyspora hattusasensis TaxID=1128679 RepID=UPI003D9852BC